jgi:hypothetical protein
VASVLAAIPLSSWTPARRLVRSLAAVVLIAGGAVSLAYLRGIGTRWNYNLAEGYPYRHALGMETGVDYLKRALRVFPALDSLNQKTPLPGKVFAPTAQMRWGLKTTLDDPVYRPDRTALIVLPAGNALAAEIRSNGYEYLLVDTALARDPKSPYRDEAFLKRHTDLAFASPQVFVYRMRPSPRDAASAAGAGEILENGNFNEVSAEGVPAGWIAFGKPTLVVKPKAAYSPPAFADVTQEDGFLQRFTAKPGSVYTTRMWARADREKQSAWIQILWFDRQLKILDTSITAVPVTAEWKLYSATITAAAPNVAFAQVYARAAGGCRVQVDDISVVEGW